MNALEIDAVGHSYGSRRALDSVSLGVGRGEIFGLLGPNGGGKTTLFRVLATLLPPATGAARVCGHDCVAEPDAVRRRIGVVFQSPSLDRKLTVMENVRTQARLYGVERREERAREMLARVGLADRAGDRVELLSGGLRRRVELAKGMLHAPDVLLLDEPSTGLDPGARIDLWTHLRELRDESGVTAFVTTHLMEEAERCDRLAILDRGRLVALGTPDELKARIGGSVLTLDSAGPDALARDLAAKFDVEAQVVEGRVRVEREDAAAFVPRLMEEFASRIDAVSLGRPTLEEVFVRETGHRFWSDEE